MVFYFFAFWNAVSIYLEVVHTQATDDNLGILDNTRGVQQAITIRLARHFTPNIAKSHIFHVVLGWLYLSLFAIDDLKTTQLAFSVAWQTTIVRVCTKLQP